MTHRKSLPPLLAILFSLAIGAITWTDACGAERADVKPFDFEEASRDVPKPRELYPIVRQDMVPTNLKILSDEIVPSDTDPSKKLRKVTAFFHSLKITGRTWGSPCVILAPADGSINAAPERRGKVVIVGSPGWAAFPAHVAKYAEPIVARTGYPTMVLESPGVYVDDPDRIIDIQDLARMREQTGKDYYNMNCQLALIYMRAIDVMQEILDLGDVDVKAVVGGHSKLGRSATVSAAMDPRVAGVVILGNEGVYRTDQIQWHLSFHHAFFQEQVNVPVLYIGATNEDGYKMFNVNTMQERLRRPMTIEMIPNYRHHNFHDKQYIDFMMWVAHVFDGRPITRISDVSYERRDGRNYYRAKIEGEAKIQLVLVWYVYAENPEWVNLMWYDWLMVKRGDYYETSSPGARPDAFMIEVADIAQGIPGYVTSLPQKISDAPVVERDSSKARFLGPPERQGKE